MSNPYNPYGQPAYSNPYGGFYGQPYAQPQPQPQPAMPPAKPTFDFVNGVEGAKSYGVAPNRTAILMDTENAAVYIKSANGIGQCGIEFYTLSKSSEEAIRAQRQKAENAAFVTKDEFASVVQRLASIESMLAPKEAPKEGDAK